MDFHGSFIQDDQIIGISALWMKDHPSETTSMLYKPIGFEYEVFTKQNRIPIKSNWFYREGVENPTAEKLAALKWQRDYVAVYQNVWDMLQPAKDHGHYPVSLKALEARLQNELNKIEPSKK